MTDLYESLKGLISRDENVSKVFDTVKNAIDEYGLDAVLEKFKASGLDRQGAVVDLEGQECRAQPGRGEERPRQ